MVQPLNITIEFIPPFKIGMDYRPSLGCHGSPVVQHEERLEPSALNDAYNELINNQNGHNAKQMFFRKVFVLAKGEDEM